MQLIERVSSMTSLLWPGREKQEENSVNITQRNKDERQLGFFWRADIVDYGNALNLTKYLDKESEYIVWKRVASSIAYVRDMMSNNEKLYPKFQVSKKMYFSFQIFIRDQTK